MAIAYDNSASSAETDNNTTAETAAWTIAGANRFLAGFMSSGANTPANANALAWGGSGGTALTIEGTGVTFATNIRLTRFSLTAPAAANQTLHGTWAAAQDEAVAAGASFTGIDQAAPLRTSPTPTTGVSATPSITATTVAGDVVVAACWVLDPGGSGRAITSDGAQTVRQVHHNGTPFAFEIFSMDTKDAVGTSTTLTWTIGGSSPESCSWIVMAFVLRPAAAGGTTTEKTLTDTLVVSDQQLPSAVRGRVLSDAMVLSEGPTVFSTVYGLLFGDDLTISDQIGRMVVRGRLGEDAIDVTDSTSQFFRRTRLADDSIAVSDEALASLIVGAILTRVLTSQIDITDAPIASAVRIFIGQSSIAVIDEILAQVVGNNILLKVLTSQIDVTDGAVLSIIRARLLQDTLIIDEGQGEQYITTNLTVDDDLAVTDSSLTRLLLTRLLGDSIDLTDSAIAAIVGQNVIERVLTDSIDTADDAIRWMNRVRFGESVVLTADEIVKVMRLTRQLSDAIDLLDGTATAMQRFILLTDTLSVQDVAIASYIPDTGPVTHNPVIRIGFDQPRIEIGGRALI